jgi:hypothetical protein
VTGRLLAALVLLLPASWAQTSAATSSLEGALTDSISGRIPGATVKLRETETNAFREGVTSAEGNFRISGLAPGIYEILVNQPGFAVYRHQGVTLALGATVHLDIVLKSRDVASEITVSAQPPPLDPAQTSITASVDTERIEELPVESRNYLNFVLLAPGVSPSAASGRSSLGPLPDSGFSFGGLRTRSNNVTIDGVDNNDEYLGSSRTELSLETVREFQVVNSGLSAETGGASGGSINVVTRSGSNMLHGDAFLFHQNGSLNATNPFESERSTPTVHKYRAGLAAGGPIVRDRTFFYIGAEQEHNRSLEDADIPREALACRCLPITDNRFPAARAETELSARLDHRLSFRNSLMLRYAFANNREAGDAFHNSGLDDPSSRGSSFTRDQAVVGSLTTVFGASSVGDLRFQVADRRAVVRSNDTTDPGVDIAGVVSFGRPYEGNGRRSEGHEQAGYTYSYAAGKHLLKAGATLHRVDLDAGMADGFGGLYLYAGIPDYIAGRPTQFRQSFGESATNFAVLNAGGFVQDHWSIAPKLTLDLGLRYDIERLPDPLPLDTNNFSPRIGLAWHVAPGWVLRAGYGVFFDRFVLAALNRVMQKNGVTAFEQIDHALPSIYRADPRLATPYSQQTSVAAERLIARDLTASASYLFVRGVKLPRTRNVNRPVLDPRYADIFQLEDSASSTYQGISLALNRRMSDELEFSAAYTLSKTIDDASDFAEQPQNPLNLAAERALSLQNQKHRLVFNALWELPIGDAEPGKPRPSGGFDRAIASVFGHIEVAPIFTVESGRPVNPLTGVDTLLTHAYPVSARPLGYGRNSLQTPLLANMDFRLLKFIPFGKASKLDIVAEAFNMFNRANVAQIDPVFGPYFGRPITGAGARRLQFSLDFEF